MSKKGLRLQYQFVTLKRIIPSVFSQIIFFVSILNPNIDGFFICYFKCMLYEILLSIYIC